MNILTQASSQQRGGSCVVALHCSLGSGRQWTKLAAALGPDTKLIAPDLAGYGNNPRAFDLPTTLSAEVESLSEHLRDATGPIHLVDGRAAFKLHAARSRRPGRGYSPALLLPIEPPLQCEARPIFRCCR